MGTYCSAHLEVAVEESIEAASDKQVTVKYTSSDYQCTYCKAPATYVVMRN